MVPIFVARTWHERHFLNQWDDVVGHQRHLECGHECVTVADWVRKVPVVWNCVRSQNYVFGSLQLCDVAITLTGFPC